jgi:hypothetical protein
MAEGGELLWLYGVTEGTVPDRHGVDGLPVEAIRRGPLTVLFSRVPAARFDEAALRSGLEDMSRLEALARGHEHVLDGALDGGPVVPFRLCTLYERDEGIEAMLEERHDELLAELDRVRGKAEWSVKVLHRPAERVGAAEPATSGTDYLARRRRAREDTAAAAEVVNAAATVVHEALRGLAEDAAVVRPQDRRLSGLEGEMVLNGAYLVADDRSAGFRATLEDLAARHEPYDLHFTLSGPWPAHHFTGVAT